MILSKPSRELDTALSSSQSNRGAVPDLKAPHRPIINLKNPTPNGMALAAAFFSSLVVVSLSLLAKLYHGVSSATLLLFVVPSASFISTYFIFRYFLKRFILRKVKVIYKNIHSRKLQSNERMGNLDMSNNVLDEVEKEMEEWAANEEKEAKQLKTWQEYRRRFLGDISHELKTPIFNIQGYLETLLDGGMEDESINKNYLKRAAKNVERLSTIVEDLESISRLESGELILDIRPFDIKKLTEEVFDGLEIKAKERNIRLHFKAGADQPYTVKADRDYIRQVLTNLVNNSLKYGREGGNTKVSFYDMDKFILVEVADTGIGISPDHHKRLFDRFYRVDKSRSREQGGSGLGLSIVKHIMEAHKQTITVRSTPGLGSTFGFTLEKA
ncbi:MAG: sensor histidine kinase [Saprospiraceae bacterium]|nr:sensor histidine kinase [Saprospiraceae bacterium]